jgi:hypothetical protein
VHSDGQCGIRNGIPNGVEELWKGLERGRSEAHRGEQPDVGAPAPRRVGPILDLDLPIVASAVEHGQEYMQRACRKPLERVPHGSVTRVAHACARFGEEAAIG